MSNFCASCGAGTAGGKFCPKCGSPQVDGAAPSSSPSQMPYALPAKRKSPILKIVLVVLALFMVLGAAAVIKGYYFLKDTVREAKQEMADSKSGPAQETKAGCDLVSKEKVSEILGAPLAATKGNEAGAMREYCNYLSPANVAANVDRSDDDADAKEHQPSLKDLESIARKISEVSKNRPLLSAQIYRGNAAAALIGIKTVGRLAGASQTKIPGPWDEAYFGIKDTTLVVRKGQNGILLDLTQIDKKREAGVAIAKEMVSGL